MFNNTHTENMSEYDVIITASATYSHSSETVEIGRMHFYRDFEQCFCDFVSTLCQTMESLELAYSFFPDAEVSLELHIRKDVPWQ
jgi:cytochrome c oxidase assembly protein Cox11